ncbi:MAG: acyltransferase [Prevotellaceae bacterium]|nr:acyltransferase [Candidatus Minthosoma equi]
MISVHKRQSNFEILRILCMLGVVIGHVLLYLYQDEIHSQDMSLCNQGRVFLLNGCAVAVNCFVLISGYFTVRLTWSKVVRYVAMCLWYAVLVYLLLGGSWLQVLFPVSETELWFVPCYLVLMLMSPLLNAGLSSMSKRTLRRTVLFMLLADVYIGYMHQCEYIGVDGYGIFHLICVYSLGYLLAKEQLIFRFPYLWVLSCFVVMTALHALKMFWYPISAIYSLHYNSPIMIVASILVFQWAKELKFYSRVVNWVAGSVFAVYLILSNPSASSLFHDCQNACLNFSDSPIVRFCMLCLLILGAFVCCILLDKIRIWVFNRIEGVCQSLS